MNTPVLVVNDQEVEDYVLYVNFENYVLYNLWLINTQVKLQIGLSPCIFMKIRDRFKYVMVEIKGYI